MRGMYVALVVCAAILLGFTLWWSLDGAEPSGSYSARPGAARSGSSVVAVAPSATEFESSGVDSSPEAREEAAAKREARVAGRRVDAPNPDVVTISGRILDPWSVPLDGARVQIVYRNRKSPGYTRIVFADIHGRFKITTREPGEIELHADYPDHLGARLELGQLHKGDVRENVDLRLGTSAVVTGTVFWSDHTPARWVKVEAFDMPRPHRRASPSLYSEPKRALTDEEGRFEISGFTSDPIRLEASVIADEDRAAGASNERFHALAEDVIPGHGSVIMVLGQGARIRGRVIDDFGAPLTSGYILFKPIGNSGGVVRRHFQDANGSFDIRKLHAGAYQVAASGGAAGAGPSVTVEAPGLAEDLLLVAPRGARLAGAVLAGGVPVAKAQISLWFLHGQSDDTLHEDARARNPGEMQTNSKGHFDLRSIMVGTHLLTASHAGHGRTEFEMKFTSGEESADFVIELEPTGRIEGRLAGDVRPAADRIVHISSEAHSANTGVLTDAAGQFAIENLMPGQYIVRLAAADSSGHLPVEHDEAVIVADVIAGQTTSVVLGGMRRAVRIEGQVVCNGVSQPGIEVWMGLPEDGASELATIADADGRFVVERAYGGSFWFFFGPEGTGAGDSVFVPDGAVLKRTFELPSGTISGRVVDRAGAPAGGALVRLEWHEGFVAHQTTADDEGAFSFSYVEPDRYVLSGGGRNWGKGSTQYGYDRSQPFDFVAGQDLTGLSLTLPSAASLRGRILPRQGGGVIEEVVYMTARPLGFGTDFTSEVSAEIEGDHYSFTALGPGEYTLEVMACCEHGGSLTRNVTVVEGTNVVLDLQVE